MHIGLAFFPEFASVFRMWPQPTIIRERDIYVIDRRSNAIRVAYNAVVGRRSFVPSEQVSGLCTRSHAEHAARGAKPLIDCPMCDVQQAPYFLGAFANMKETQHLSLGLG